MSIFEIIPKYSFEANTKSFTLIFLMFLIMVCASYVIDYHPQQAHLVIGGTLEGSLHLWDLREHSALHQDR